MPIYEYRCRSCQRSFEVWVPTARAGAAQCTACGSAAIDRLPSRFSLRGAVSVAAPERPDGGCCGGGCGCASRGDGE